MIVSWAMHTGLGVLGATVAPRPPVVADQAGLEVEDTLAEDLPLALPGATHDQQQLAVVGRRLPDVRKAGVELLGGAMRHGRRGYDV